MGWCVPDRWAATRWLSRWGGLQQGCNDWELSRALKKSVEKDSVMGLGSWEGQLRSSPNKGCECDEGLPVAAHHPFFFFSCDNDLSRHRLFFFLPPFCAERDGKNGVCMQRCYRVVGGDMQLRAHRRLFGPWRR